MRFSSFNHGDGIPYSGTWIKQLKLFNTVVKKAREDPEWTNEVF